MREKRIAGIGVLGFFACVLGLSLNGCGNGNGVPRPEFERRMADVAASGNEIERWAQATQAWMVEVTAILARLDDQGVPPDPPDPPPCQPDCTWGQE